MTDNSKAKQLKLNLNYQTRKTAGEAEFKNIAQKYFQTFYTLTNEAFSKLTTEISAFPKTYRDRNWFATTMIGHIRGCFIDEFGIDNPEIRMVKEKHGIYHLNVNNKYKVYFKKLDNNLLPHDNNTYNASKRRYQLTEKQSIDSKPILYLGYVTNPEWSHIENLYILYIEDGSNLIWRIDLDDEVNNTISITNLKTSTIVDDEEEILVKPRIKKVAK